MNKSANVEGGRGTVLIITRNLPPLRGGMERLNRHLAIELSTEFHVQVVGPDGCRAQLPPSIDVQEVRVRPLWRFLWQALHHSLRLARRTKPQVVFAGSGLTAPFAVVAAWLVGARSVVYAHGLDLVVRNWVYRLLWLPFLRRCDLCIVNSRNTGVLARQVGIRSERVTVIHPGVTMPVWNGDGAGAEFRKKNDLLTNRLLLSVGRLTPRKGLMGFLRNAMPHIVAAHPSAVLVVVGDEAPDALNGSGAGASAALLHCAKGLGLEKHILLLGACGDQELEGAYDAADLCVFPLVEMPGDIEGFGMVAIEAAAHGLPTVAFNVGGVGDAIADHRSGRLVPAGSYSNFIEHVIEVLNVGRTRAVQDECRRFAESFEWGHFGDRLRGQVGRLMGGRDSEFPA